MEFTLLWAALTGVACLYLGAKYLAGGEAADMLDDLLVSATIGLIGGRVVEMLSQGLNPVTNPADLLIVRGGVNTPAAAGIAILAFYFISGRRMRNLDKAAPAVLLGLGGWQLGCLWRGACLGTAADLPWTWSEVGSTIDRHPVELYAAVGFVAVAWLASRVDGRRGTRAGLALASAAGIRLVTEPLRLSITGGPVAWYVVGLLIGLIALAVSASMTPDRAEQLR